MILNLKKDRINIIEREGEHKLGDVIATSHVDGIHVTGPKQIISLNAQSTYKCDHKTDVDSL